MNRTNRLARQVVVGLFSLALGVAPVPAAVVGGSEVQVNSHTQGFQFDADVSSDANGNSIVVWASEQDGDLDSIHARGLRRAEMFTGAPLLVNSYTENVQGTPKVALDPSGLALVVWQSFGSPGDDGSNSSIQAQTYGYDGRPIGGQFQVNTFTLNGQTVPAVARGSGGQSVVVWRSRNSDGTDNSGWSIRGRKLPGGADQQLNDVVTGDQDHPAVGMASDGSFVVAWESPSSAGADPDFSIQARRFSSAGVPLAGQFQVNDVTSGGQVAPSVAVAPNGDFVIAWTSDSSGGSDPDQSVQARLYNAAGVAQGGQIQVNSDVTADLQSSADVAWVGGASPGWVIVWDSLESDWRIRARRFDATLSPIGGEIVVNTYETGDQTFPSVGADRRGGFVVAWYSTESPEDAADAIRARRFRDDDLIFADGFESGDLLFWSNGAGAGDHLEVDCATPAVSDCNGEAGDALTTDPTLLQCRATLTMDMMAIDVTDRVEWSTSGVFSGAEIWSGGSVFVPGAASGSGTIAAQYGGLSAQDVLSIATGWALDALQLVLSDGQAALSAMQFLSGTGIELRPQASYSDLEGFRCVFDLTGLVEMQSSTPSVCQFFGEPWPRLFFSSGGTCSIDWEYEGVPFSVDFTSVNDTLDASSIEPKKLGSDAPVTPGDGFELFADVLFGDPPRTRDVTSFTAWGTDDPTVGEIGWSTGFGIGQSLPGGLGFFAKETGSTTINGSPGGVAHDLGVEVTADCLDIVDLWIDALPGPVDAVAGETLEAMVFGTFRSGAFRELEIDSEVSVSPVSVAGPSGLELVSRDQGRNWRVDPDAAPATVSLLWATGKKSLLCSDAVQPADIASIHVSDRTIDAFELSLTPPLGDATFRIPARYLLSGKVDYDDGTKRVDPPGVDWSSSDPGKASVVQDPTGPEHGLVESWSAGVVTLKGGYGGLTFQAAIDLDLPVLDHIELQALKTSFLSNLFCPTPRQTSGFTSVDNEAVYWQGTDSQLRVLAYYQGEAEPRDVTRDSFYVSGDTEAIVTFNGEERGTLEVRSSFVGPVTLTAFFGGEQDSIVVGILGSGFGTLEATYGRKFVLEYPAPAPLVSAATESGGLHAAGGNVICFPPTTFTSGDADVVAVAPTTSRRASVDRSPPLTGRAWLHPTGVGTTNVTVRLGELEVVVPVQVVDDTIASVRIEPVSESLPSGSTDQLRAIATLTGGGEAELTWSAHGDWTTTGTATSIDAWGVVFGLDVASDTADTIDFCHPNGSGGTVCASTGPGAATITVTALP